MQYYNPQKIEHKLSVFLIICLLAISMLLLLVGQLFEDLSSTFSHAVFCEEMLELSAYGMFLIAAIIHHPGYERCNEEVV